MTRSQARGSFPWIYEVKTHTGVSLLRTLHDVSCRGTKFNVFVGYSSHTKWPTPSSLKLTATNILLLLKWRRLWKWSSNPLRYLTPFFSLNFPHILDLFRISKPFYLYRWRFELEYRMWYSILRILGQISGLMIVFPLAILVMERVEHRIWSRPASKLGSPMGV